MVRKLPEIKHVRANIIVKGFVQGVSFRAYTVRKARELNLTGYVRNLPNGDVEVEAQGNQIQVMHLIEWLKNEGSPASQVTEVIVNWLNKLEMYKDFRIAY